MAIQSKAAQEFVPIEEIRDGIVILKDGGMRAIAMTSSLNFALKSEENQQAIILQFQNFLNSLDFAVQIFIQSRRIDIRPYLALLESRHKEQTDDLMKIQTREYIDFVKTFTETTSIMTKTFFIVVPYSGNALGGKKGGFPISLGGLKGKDKDEVTKRKEEAFEENRAQLEQRLSVIEQGLVRCGIRAVQLGTEEIIELYYKIFNPGEVEKPIQIN